MSVVEILSDGEIPIYLARATGLRPPKWINDWYIGKIVEWHKSGRAERGVVCRGVDLERLEFVLEHGLDVPSGSPLWVDIAIDKAWEYGGPRKLILMLAQHTLQLSHHAVPFDTPDEQLELLKKEYRTVLRLEDQREFYFSRLDPSDRRLATGYEVAHCRFPAGDPRDCLLALLVVLPPEAPLDPIKGLLA